jgi:O-antigen ligase
MLNVQPALLEAARRPLDAWILAVVVLFPAAVATVPSGGSAAYVPLLLASLFLVRRGWARLEAAERRIVLALLVFLAVILLSMINTEAWSVAGRKMERYARIALAGSVIVLLIDRGLPMARVLLAGLAAGAVAVFAHAVAEVHVLGQGIAEGAYHKIVFGDTAALLAALLLVGLLTLARGRWRWVLGALALLAVYAAVLSYTRSSWLFLVLLLPFLAVALGLRRPLRQVARFVVVCVLGLALASPWVVEPVQRGVQAGINDLRQFQTQPHTSWGTRLSLWAHSLEISGTHPWLGTGVGDFDTELQQRMDRGESRLNMTWGHAHNQYLHVLATLGGLGLVVFLGAIFLIPGVYFFRGWRAGGSPEADFFALGGLVFLFAYAVFGIAEAWMGRNPFANQYAFYLAVFVAGLAIERRRLARAAPEVAA